MTRGLLGTALLLAFATALVLLARGRETGPAPASTAAGAALGAPSSCRSCHAAVVDEWQASMHAQSFTDPQVRAPDQADDFRKAECLPCHASAPIFAHGIQPDTRVLARIERRADGVDCLSCHALPEGGVAATRPGLSGACRPVLREELSTERMCAACHDQHDTHAEWRASPAAAAGRDCLDCHMPRVARTQREAGAPRSGASHRFLGGRDRDFALAGLALDHTREGDTLAVKLSNTFAGHNLPTDSRNRALDLVVTLLDAAGRPAWGEAGTARLRLRNPYRSEAQPNGQLPAGEQRELSLALPPQARRATIELFYKLQPYVADAEAHWILRQEIDLDG